MAMQLCVESSYFFGCPIAFFTRLRFGVLECSNDVATEVKEAFVT
jgi:hypothetical protein